MAENYNYYITLAIFIIAFCFPDIFCADGTLALQKPSPSDNNPWQKGNLDQPLSDVINSKSTTTPWPELGQKQPKPNEKRDFVAIPNSQIPNKNVVQANPNNREPLAKPNQQTNRDFVAPSRPNLYRPSNQQKFTNDFIAGEKQSVNPNINQNTKPNLVNQPNRPSVSLQQIIGPQNNNQNKNLTPVKPNIPSSPSKPTVSTPKPIASVNISPPPKSSQINPKPDFPALPNSPNKPLGPAPTWVRPTTSAPSVPLKPQVASVPTNVSPTGPSTTAPNANSPDTQNKNKMSEDEELREFSETLVKKDTNNANKYVQINYQGMTRSTSFKDEAKEPLLKINEEAYKIPSIEKLVLLHNNYILESNVNEVYTPQERIEENNFLDTILPTPIMQYTRNFLIQKGKISKDPKDFKDLLRTIWFNMYSRGGGKIGSSGFEHVFLAEVKNEAISGLHNWVYFNDIEQKNQANYLGYMKKLEFEKGAILKYHFNLNNIDKPVGSMFIGTSPEFEIALYSTCFLLRPDDVCPLRLGGKNFVIRTYTYRYRGKTLIGSAFPEI